MAHVQTIENIKNWIIPFGKVKDLTIEQAYVEQPGWCYWIIQEFNKKGQHSTNQHFEMAAQYMQAYINYVEGKTTDEMINLPPSKYEKAKKTLKKLKPGLIIKYDFSYDFIWISGLDIDKIYSFALTSDSIRFDKMKAKWYKHKEDNFAIIKRVYNTSSVGTHFSKDYLEMFMSEPAFDKVEGEFLYADKQY